MPICAEHGLTPLVDGIFGATLDESGTKADVIARALAAEPVVGSPTVMVGDRLHDVEGAREHGIDTIGVTWGYAAPGELAAAGAVAETSTPPPACWTRSCARVDSAAGLTLTLRQLLPWNTNERRDAWRPRSRRWPG